MSSPTAHDRDIYRGLGRATDACFGATTIRGNGRCEYTTALTQPLADELLESPHRDVDAKEIRLQVRHGYGIHL